MLSDERSLENGYNELQEGADESQKKMATTPSTKLTLLNFIYQLAINKESRI